MNKQEKIKRERKVFESGFSQGVESERERILDMIIEWENTIFGSTDNRIDAFQEVKKKIGGKI